MSILPKILPRNDAQRHAAAQRQLIHFESQFGRNIFGAIPADHHRDFFCLDENTWIWHEDWIDDEGKSRVTSTRYVLRPDGAIKSVNNSSYQKVQDQESRHLYLAIKKYITAAQSSYAQYYSAA